MRQPSAIRRLQGGSNLIGARLRAVRKARRPKISMEGLAELVLDRTGVPMTRAILLKVEADLRSVYDYEVVALSVALDIDVRYLLGLQDLEGRPIPFRMGFIDLAPANGTGMPSEDQRTPSHSPEDPD